MRILFFHPFTRSSPVFEWGLDIMQRHLDAGDSVVSLTCDGELPSCDINPEHRYSVCNKCTIKRGEGHRLLGGNFRAESFLKLMPENVREIAALPVRFESLAELKALQFDGWDIGWSVAASLISLSRDPNPNLEQHAEVISN